MSGLLTYGSPWLFNHLLTGMILQARDERDEIWLKDYGFFKGQKGRDTVDGSEIRDQLTS